ncbi:MAG TPA: hypothetical protein VFC39_22320 [Acidobacteriaceae bacterium]|nr:hypothetical protein [Acidobacteriaceae bacterium]
MLTDAACRKFELATVLALNLTSYRFAGAAGGFAHALPVKTKLIPPDVTALFE